MSMNLNDYKSEGGERKPIPRMEEGSFPARVVQLISLGRQYKTNYLTGEIETYEDGNPIIQPKVFVTWEFPTEMIEIDGEDKPRWQSKEFTLSAHEKAALPQLLKVGGVTNDDVTQVINAPMLVSIGSTNTDKAKVTGYTKLPKGMEVPELINEPKIFDPYSPDMGIYEKLPNFLKEKITNAVDYDRMPLSKGQEKSEEPELESDDITF